MLLLFIVVAILLYMLSVLLVGVNTYVCYYYTRVIAVGIKISICLQQERDPEIAAVRRHFYE